MKKTLVTLLVCGLLVLSATGCGSAEAAEDIAQDGALEVESDGESLAAPPQADGEAPEDGPGTVGKVAAVSDSEITVYLAELGMDGERPEGGGPGDGNGPGDGAEPPDGDAPGGAPEEGGPGGDVPADLPDGEAPEGGPGDGEPPSGGRDGEGGPGGMGGGMMGGVEFSDEETVYTLSASVTVTKGMGDDAEALSLDDIGEDDVVRLELDDDGEVIAIQVMEMPDMDGEPPEQD